jgi:hypothetical protein
MQTIEGFTTSELVIEDVEPEDAGQYTVIVENSAGMAQCEAKLEVVGQSITYRFLAEFRE